MLVSIDTIRNHLRMDYVEDITDDIEIQRENQYLEMLYEGAVERVSSFLEYDITKMEKVPKDIIYCILSIIADRNENREGQTDKQLYTNTMVEKTLQLYRINIGV